jgi:type II secretory pathway component GspD/PulD (secretin)
MSKEAKDLYAAGKIMEAHDVWTKILEIQPDNAEALAFMEQTKDAYQKAIDDQKKAEEVAARQAEIETLLNQNVPLLDLKDTDIDNVLSLLGTISGFNIVATEGVEGIITVNIRNKTVREALDMILIPNGFKYTIAGKDITVSTNFITKIFPLDEAAYNKVSKILEDPTSLEDPTKELRRLIYGEAGVSPIPGKELRLNPNTRSLIVSDTEDNLAKVSAFLQNIPDFVQAKEPLVSRHFKLDPDWAKQVYRLIELQLYGEIGKRSLAADDPRLLVLEPDTNIMIVKDTVNRIKDVEAILNNQALLEQLKREELIAKEFKISLEPEPPEGVSRTEWLYRREQEVSFVIDVLTQMLYGFEGQEEAIAKGRRIFKRGDYNLEQDGTITVVDTPENIKKVEDFLSQAQGRGQIIVEPLQIKHADINALRTLLDRVTGRRRDSDTEGGDTVDDDRQDRLQITFTPDPNSQTIIVRSRAQLRDAVDSIKDLILKLDVPIPQVEIESRLVEIKMEDNKALNFDWDFYELFEDSDNPLRIPGGINRTSGLGMISDQAQGMALSLATFGNSRFNFAMNWIEQLSNAEVLSAPKVTVTSDSEATINIVTNEPYISGVEINTQGTDTSADDQQIITYDITPVGITLTVTPTVLGDQSVVMNVNTAITAITGRLPIQIPATEGGGTSVAAWSSWGSRLSQSGPPRPGSESRTAILW